MCGLFTTLKLCRKLDYNRGTVLAREKQLFINVITGFVFVSAATQINVKQQCRRTSFQQLAVYLHLHCVCVCVLVDGYAE